MIVEKKYIKIITYGNFPFGGASANLLRYFSLALAHSNNDVEIVLPTGNYIGHKIDVNSKRNGNIENVKYKHLCFKNHPLNYLGKLLDILCGFTFPIFYLYKECFKNKLDKIILYDTFFVPTLLFLFIKVTLRKKLIIIVPDLYEKPKAKLLSFELIKWYDFYIGLKLLSRYADGYIVVSTYLKKYINDTLKISKPVQIIPSLIDPQKFIVTDSKPFIKNKITIGYAGTPSRRDGVMDLIESFSVLNKKYPNIHLLIIGDVVDTKKTLLPELNDYALKFGVTEDITFTGLVSYTEIPKLLNSCQILALIRPSGEFAEAGFPTKLGEYFACKKPVVITSVGDIPFYFKNKEHAIIVSPEDLLSIISGFELLLNDEKLSHHISENAYNWMNLNLNYKKLSSKLDIFINRI